MRVTRQVRQWGIAVVMVVTWTAVFAPKGARLEAGGMRHRIEIQRFAFVPERLIVAPGDTVVWVNLDLVPHTITAQDERWDSQTLETNKEWEMRVTEEMAGNYFCRYHPMMKGQVHVRRQ